MSDRVGPRDAYASKNSFGTKFTKPTLQTESTKQNFKKRFFSYLQWMSLSYKQTLVQKIRGPKNSWSVEILGPPTILSPKTFGAIE